MFASCDRHNYFLDRSDHLCLLSKTCFKIFHFLWLWDFSKKKTNVIDCDKGGGVVENICILEYWNGIMKYYLFFLLLSLFVKCLKTKLLLNCVMIFWLINLNLGLYCYFVFEMNHFNVLKIDEVLSDCVMQSARALSYFSNHWGYYIQIPNIPLVDETDQITPFFTTDGWFGLTLMVRIFSRRFINQLFSVAILFKSLYVHIWIYLSVLLKVFFNNFYTQIKILCFTSI